MEIKLTKYQAKALKFLVDAHGTQLLDSVKIAVTLPSGSTATIDSYGKTTWKDKDE